MLKAKYAHTILLGSSNCHIRVRKPTRSIIIATKSISIFNVGGFSSLLKKLLSNSSVLSGILLSDRFSFFLML